MGAPAITAPSRGAPSGASARRQAAPARKPARTAAPARSAKPKPRSATAAKASAVAPARRPASTRRASQHRGAQHARVPVQGAGAVAMLPVAAVSGLADCGVVMGMARSRVWIGVLGVLLGGIVALNVWGLSLSSTGSATATQIDELGRENGVLRARIAKRLSSDKVGAAATSLGLTIPAPDAIGYLRARGGDAAKAAARLDAGAIASGPPPPTVAEAAAEAAAAEPAAPVDASTTAPAPTAEAPTPVAPASEALAPEPVAPLPDPAAVP